MLGLIVAVLALKDTDYVLDDAMIAEINSENGGWRAGRNARFEGVTFGEAKAMLGVFDSERLRGIPIVVADPNIAVPDEFDSRTQWPGKISAIRDQAHCGSCWAFANAETLTDRYAIQGQNVGVLSPQDLVSCDNADNGCNGGWPTNSWAYTESTGIVTDSCMPYTSSGGDVQSCPTTCQDGQPFTKYKTKKGSTRSFANAAAMQQNMFTYGPIEITMAVYNDFFSYKSGVYRHKTGGLAGYHAIKAIGWGIDAATKEPFWTVANSWGTSWGADGYF
jgi:cathepsin B